MLCAPDSIKVHIIWMETGVLKMNITDQGDKTNWSAWICLCVTVKKTSECLCMLLQSLWNKTTKTWIQRDEQSVLTIK